MNEQALKAIESMAEKLGTTVEFLWGILVRQATVEGIQGIAFFVLTVLAGVGLFFWWKAWDKGRDDNNSFYYESEEFFFSLLMSFSILLLSCSIVAILNLGHVASCFVNPEYFALNKILETLN
jgi:hypothetical protein